MQCEAADRVCVFISSQRRCVRCGIDKKKCNGIVPPKDAPLAASSDLVHVMKSRRKGAAMKQCAERVVSSGKLC